MSRKKVEVDSQIIIQISAGIADQEGIEAVTRASFAKRLSVRPLPYAVI